MTLAVVCHTNDHAVLSRRLLLSLAQQTTPADAILIRDTDPSMTRAYAAADAMDRATVSVYLHQDIVCAGGLWLARLRWLLGLLEREDPRWAVVGVFGTLMLEGRQRYRGDIRDTFEHRQHTPDGRLWWPVESIDGCAIIKRTQDADLAWDVQLPGWHGYAEDLCMQAHAARRGVYALNLYTEHWCKHTDLTTNANYQAAAAYVRQKWAGRMRTPFATSVGVWT